MISAHGNQREATASTSPPPMAVAAGLALLVVGVLGAFTLTGQPDSVLLVILVPIGAIACARYPAEALVGVFVITGAIGSLTAFSALPTAGIGEAVLLCLWLGVIWSYLVGGHKRSVLPWFGLLVPALYIALTVVQIFTSTPVSSAIESFRLSTWYMLAFLLVAIGPWPPETHRRAVRGIVLVCCAIGGYAIFRKLAGPSVSEYTLAKASLPRLAAGEDLRFFASFLTAHQLSAWCATTIPFLFALALAWRGRWRLLAAFGIATLGVAVFASNVRTGVLAALVGAVVVLALFVFSRAYAGRGLGIALIGVAGLALVAGTAYATTVAGSPETADRFSRILTPTEDPDYQKRLERWGAALDEIEKEPFGHGLGTAGFVGQRRPFGPVGHPNLDSSYLKIAIEQGFVVMVLFVLGLLVLLGGLAIRALRASDPFDAQLGIAACGVLVSLMVLFYAGVYIEGVTALSAWILIGLGAARFSTVPAHRSSKPAERLPRPGPGRLPSAAAKTASVRST